MKTLLRLVLGLCGVAILCGCDNSVNLVALTNTGEIITFSTSKPSDIGDDVTLTGLASGVSLVQIAYRPVTGGLYGITSNNQLVTVDSRSGAVIQIGSGLAFTNTSLSDVVASWDPVTDLLRVISGSHNFTLDSLSALITVDTGVAFSASDANAGKTPQLAAMAYDNGRAGVSSSTLFALDVTTQSLVIVGGGAAPDPAAGGLLSTVGTLGLTFGSNAGFAIQASTNTAYAALAPSGQSASLYTIDLSGGAASLVNAIGGGGRTIISLASPP